MKILLKAKTVLVTGGSRGIGRAICMAMAKEGARVVVNYVTHKEAAEEVVKSIRENGEKALSFCADVSNREKVKEMVEEITKRVGQIDILVNNAAVVIFEDMLNTTPVEWKRMFEVNTNGYFHCTQIVARHMIERRIKGRIINISSICASLAVTKRAGYSATKGAINAFTRCCALELAPYGILVNAISPGATDTDVNLSVYTPATRRALQKKIPIGRIANPEDMAGAVIFLASKMANYITGQIVTVDGGVVSSDYTPTEYEEEEISSKLQ